MNGSPAQNQILGIPKTPPPEQFRPPTPKGFFAKNKLIKIFTIVFLILLVVLALAAVILQKRGQGGGTGQSQPQVIFGGPTPTTQPRTTQTPVAFPKTGPR